MPVDSLIVGHGMLAARSWPLASDDLHAGVYRQVRGEAMHRRYIETNPRALSNLLVVDIDHEDAALRTLDNKGR